jgi:hypothetical protein
LTFFLILWMYLSTNDNFISFRIVCRAGYEGDDLFQKRQPSANRDSSGGMTIRISSTIRACNKRRLSFKAIIAAEILHIPLHPSPVRASVPAKPGQNLSRLQSTFMIRSLQFAIAAPVTRPLRLTMRGWNFTFQRLGTNEGTSGFLFPLRAICKFTNNQDACAANLIAFQTPTNSNAKDANMVNLRYLYRRWAMHYAFKTC